MTTPYISKEELTNLKNHKYSVINIGLTSRYILKHYWDFFLNNFIPIWMAPNLITFLGTLTMIVNFFIIIFVVKDFTLDSSTPSWIFPLSAISLFFYQTMDNCDGRQARKTGSSSPLGELFDHGCDAVVVVLSSVITSSIFSYGNNWLPIQQLILTWFLFWTSTWDYYHTGSMHFGYINGPEEGLLILSILSLAPYFLGASIINTPYKEFLGLTEYTFLPDWTINYGGWVIFSIMLTLAIFDVLISVFSHLYRNGKSFKEAILHLCIFFIFVGAFLVWYFSAPLLWKNWSAWLQLVSGLCFAELVGRLIVAHMAKRKLSLIQRPVIPLILIAAFSVLSSYISDLSVFQPIVVLSCSLVIVFSYFHFTLNVASEICNFLDISFFKLKAKKP